MRAFEPVVGCLEVPSQHRRDAQHTEVARAHALPVESLGLVCAAHGRLPCLHHGHRLEGTAARRQLAIGVKCDVGARALEDIPDHHDPAGMRIRQWLKQNGVHRAEDGRAGADAQRQRDRADGRKPRPLPQSARGIAEVLPQILQPARAAGIAALLLHLLRTAQRQPGLPAGFRGIVSAARSDRPRAGPDGSASP